MKTCSKCRETKVLDQFNKKGSGFQPFCRPCDKQHSKEYYEKNKERQRQQIYAARKKRQEEVKNFIVELKNNTPCADCGVQYPYYVMDFDHQRDKEFLLARAVSDGRSMESVKREIEKCEIVCSNCHRFRTYQSGVTQLAE